MERDHLDAGVLDRPVGTRIEVPSLVAAWMVMPEPPVKAVNSAQTALTSTATPPGMKPNSARKKRTSRCGACVSASTKPVAVKSGIAGSVGDAISR